MQVSKRFSRNVSKNKSIVHSGDSIEWKPLSFSNASKRMISTTSFSHLSHPSQKNHFKSSSNHVSYFKFHQQRNYSLKIISGSPFPPEIVKSLRAPIDTNDIEIKPDGILYLPEIKYRRILNKSFGPGGWAMVPQGDFIIKDGFVCQQFALYADGRFVASSWGEQSYDEQKMRFKSLATSLEGAKSNGLMRCCKDLGIASELWDPQYIIEWKKHFVAEIWATNRITGKKKKLYRRKDRPPFEYPWVEEKVVEGGGASAEWISTFDVENTAESIREDDILDDEEIQQNQQNQQNQQSQNFNQRRSFDRNQSYDRNSQGKFYQNQQFQSNQSSQPNQQFQQNQSNQSFKPQQKSQQRMDDFEDDDDDFFSTPQVQKQERTFQSQKNQPKPKQKAKPIEEEDYLDSDGEPDMFAEFNDEPEDTQKVERISKNVDENGEQFTDDGVFEEVEAPTSRGSKAVNLDLNEIVYFGKYKGKTWNDILKDRSFLNYAKWAESKMRPGEVRDKIIIAYKLAKETQGVSD